MFSQKTHRIIILVAILGLVWMPASARAIAAESDLKNTINKLPEGLNAAIQGASIPNYRPMDYPNIERSEFFASDFADGDQ